MRGCDGRCIDMRYRQWQWLLNIQPIGLVECQAFVPCLSAQNIANNLYRVTARYLRHSLTWPFNCSNGGSVSFSETMYWMQLAIQVSCAVLLFLPPTWCNVMRIVTTGCTSSSPKLLWTRFNDWCSRMLPHHYNRANAGELLILSH